jgi:hypothetical protein
MSTDFRPLTDREQQALRKMLAVEFPDHQSLESQVGGLALRECDETLYYLAPLSAQPDKVHRKTHGVPVEGVYRDKDGAIVFVWLFADEHDALVELEVWKPDGSAVITYFADADLSAKAVDAKPVAKSAQ